MRTGECKMPSAVAIRAAIRRHFAFLVEHGYTEMPVSPPTAECYAEVHFQKSHWRIAVLTTAHSTKVTMHIILPDGQRGFLSHLGDSESGADVMGDIQSKAHFLREHGLELLEGNTDAFRRVLNAIIKRQQKWIEESGITGQQSPAGDSLKAAPEE